MKNVDNYIAQYPKEVQNILRKLRETILKKAPQAKESISYGMPAFKLKGKPLAYFAAWENHIGFYATPSGNQAYKKELSVYKSGKGSVQFPIQKPLPWELIKKIVQWKANEIAKKPQTNEFPKLSAPAMRALQNAKIRTLKDLSRWDENKLLQLHGLGPSSIPLLHKALKSKGLSFKYN
ncbi:MAG: hypothetical protein JWO40_696 [Candidatus Doudnabacteria bacterium]|nr:hypothetical protein [Candidatus Doudnabacteria bacterium]